MAFTKPMSAMLSRPTLDRRPITACSLSCNEPQVKGSRSSSPLALSTPWRRAFRPCVNTWLKSTVRTNVGPCSRRRSIRRGEAIVAVGALFLGLTLLASLDAARRNLTNVGAQPSSDDPAECVADKGYHARAVLTDLDGGPWTTRIAEPQRRGVSRWHGDADARRAVYNNRTRLRSAVGQQAMRNRAELVERSFAHILDRGGMRRTWLRGRGDVHKRYLIHVAGHNLGLLMRLLIGAGTPKEAVASGWCILILLPTSDGAADAAILIVLPAHSAIPALIILNMRLDRRPD